MRLWYLSHRRPANALDVHAHARLKNEFTEDKKYHNLMHDMAQIILGLSSCDVNHGGKAISNIITTSLFQLLQCAAV